MTENLAMDFVSGITQHQGATRHEHGPGPHRDCPLCLDEIAGWDISAPGVAIAAWQPIETAPKDGTPFWAYLYQTGIRRLMWDANYYGDEGAFREVDRPDEDWEPRWWMPDAAIPLPTTTDQSREA